MANENGCARVCLMKDASVVIDELRSLEEFGVKAFLMPPADPAELAGVLWSEVPDDYKAFLALANGAQGPGLLLLGTQMQTLAGGQFEPDIIGATMDFRSTGAIGEENLALGHLTGGLLLTHHEGEKRYQVIDQSEGGVAFEFDSLYSVVADWAERKREILKKSAGED